MLKYLKIACIVFISIFILSAVSFCEESFTITTYYPSPYGVYKELRLYPNTSPSACDANNKGAMYYNDSDNQTYVCNGSDWKIGGIPSGMIAMFDTSCPSGWTRFAELDNRVPRGSATYGGTGGSDTHAHGLTRVAQLGVSGLAYTKNDQNSTAVESSWPPYLNVIWCKKN